MLRLRLARVVLCWLLLALVLAPALGLVHRVVHGGPVHLHDSSVGHRIGPAATALTDVRSARNTAESWLTQLVSGHAAGDCRLYDQHTHGDAASSTALLVLPFVPIGVVVQLQAGQAMLRWITLFDARGPPAHL